LLRELAKRHAVCVVSQVWGGGKVPPAPPGIDGEVVAIPWRKVVLGLASARHLPVQVALHHHPDFRRAVRRQVERFKPDVAVVVLTRVGGVLNELKGIPVVVDLIDALALNMAQRAERQPGLRRLWIWEARRMAAWDKNILRRSQAATVVAERDRRYLVGSDEALTRRVRVVPFGLSIAAEDPLAVARRPVVILTGNLGYFPTIDGARWFAEQVWPRVRRAHPGAEWWLAGARPSRAMRWLGLAPGVRLVPNPEDLGSLLRRAAVSVAPLFSGSGTPIKILEAMAAKVPVVTTSTGRAGLDELPPEAISSNDHPESFAQAVVDLLSDQHKAWRQSLAALRWLQLRHDHYTVTARFETVLQESVMRAAETADIELESPLV
jgi:glycosyltransferase involved in cell wall biosynthesis